MIRVYFIEKDGGETIRRWEGLLGKRPYTGEYITTNFAFNEVFKEFESYKITAVQHIVDPGFDADSPLLVVYVSKI